jgi:glycosyltransferase involved in cell wall biosynthesis
MLSVGVWIDLQLCAEAGGHVKSWQRLAQAAANLGDELDLTLHFLGERAQEMPIAENVRYICHRPCFGTDRLAFITNVKEVASQTDLAPFNPKLYPYLAHYDVIHTTHQLFTFGKTALKFTQGQAKPLVSSIHTDVPQYTEIFMAQQIERFLGPGKLSQFLLHQAQLPQKRRRGMEQQLRRYWSHCRHVLVPQARDYEQVTQVLPPSQVSFMARGIDKNLFHPRQRDRQKLEQTYGIAPHLPVLLFVGRLDPCKSVMTFGRTLHHLLSQGVRVHGLVAGQGPSQAEIRSLLGSAVTLTGVLAPEQLAWIYASSDIFVFPSQTETYGNVVVEAKASGLPVVISSQGGSAQLLAAEGHDGYRVASDDPQKWAQVLVPLITDLSKRRGMGNQAHQQVAHHWPSWQDVLERDLLPVWKAVASRGGQG